VRAKTRFAIGTLLDGSSRWIKADDIIAAGPNKTSKKSNWKYI
jgi:hypothetical protein